MSDMKFWRPGKGAPVRNRFNIEKYKEIESPILFKGAHYKARQLPPIKPITPLFLARE